MTNVYTILIRKREWKRSLGSTSRCRWEDSINMVLKETV